MPACWRNLSSLAFLISKSLSCIASNKGDKLSCSQTDVLARKVPTSFAHFIAEPGRFLVAVARASVSSYMGKLVSTSFCRTLSRVRVPPMCEERAKVVTRLATIEQ